MSVSYMAEAFTQPVRDSSERLLLIVLCDLCDEHGTLVASQHYLKDITLMSVRAIRRKLRSLEEQGLIACTTQMSGHLQIENVYQILFNSRSDTLTAQGGHTDRPYISNIISSNKNSDTSSNTNTVISKNPSHKNPPTLADVIAYREQKNLSFNPEDFYDFYEALDWLDSNGNPVKNWKLKAVYWSKKSKQPTSEPSAADFEL